MRWVLLLALVIAAGAALGACAPTKVVETPTEDPRVAALQADVARLTEDAKTPLVMWNRAIRMPPNWVENLVLPDTFTVHLVFTATAPVRARIVSLDQYAQFRNGKIVEAYVTYPATTNLDVVFHDTEGCAGYVLLLESERETVLTPKITITYAPADHLTGACVH